MRAWMGWVLVLGLGLVPAGGRADDAAPPAPPTPLEAAARPGLYAINVKTDGVRYLGEYYNPSVAAGAKELYAHDPRGRILRWSLDAVEAEPEVVLAPQAEKGQKSKVGYLYPVAAPAGRLFTVLRPFLIDWREDVGRYQRVALEVLDHDGTRLRGPLPLFSSVSVWTSEGIAWHPNGERLAVAVRTGSTPPGVYVFQPRGKEWVRAVPLPNARSNAVFDDAPDLQWQPVQGRTLSMLHDGALSLRGGADYAQYKRVETPALLHSWRDPDTILLHDLERGLVLLGVDGEEQGVIEGWRGGVAEALGGDDPRFAASRAVASAHGVAWVGPRADRPEVIGLHYVPPRAHDAEVVWELPPTGKAYRLFQTDPAWDPDRPVVFVGVPPKR